jgi:hypothetical protein
MLCGQHNTLDCNWNSISVEERHLRLCIWSQPGQLPGTSHLGLAAHQPVRIENRRRHSFWCLISCIAEHHALISRAAGVNALGDVERLTVEPNLHLAPVGVDAGFGSCVAGFVQDITGKRFRHGLNFLKVFDTLGLELSGYNHALICQHGFAGDASKRVVFQKGV